MPSRQERFWVRVLPLIGIIALVCIALAPVFMPESNPGQPAAPPERVYDVPVADKGDPLAKSPHENVSGAARYTGYVPRPAETKRFLATLPNPGLRQAGPGLFAGAADKETVVLYRALYEAYAATHNGAQWKVGAQGIGDCVSWGWAHGLDINLAVMWKLGETSEWREAATEAIYGGSRVEARGVSFGGWGDGSYGGAAAKWVSESGGAIFRQNYVEQGFPGLDLSVYSSSRAKDWGAYGNGGKGDDGKLDAEAKKHPVRSVALVRNFAEAAAAISSGYPVPVCSGQGFASRRDSDGFSAPSGRWSHCMCFVGVRHDRPGLLCLNSWGTNWVSGPKFPDDMPEGSFWVDERTATAMLSGEDSFAVSGYSGFDYRSLKHGDWTFVDPASVSKFERRLAAYRHTQDNHLALAP